MIIEQLRDIFSDFFTSHGDLSEQAQSAINVAFYQILQTPALKNHFPHIHLSQGNESFWRAVVEHDHSQSYKDFNVLKELYIDSDSIYWEAMDENEIQKTEQWLKTLPRHPTLTSSIINLYEGEIPIGIQEKAESFLQQIMASNELVESIVLDTQELPEFKHITYEWMTASEMRNYLEKKIYTHPEHMRNDLPAYDLAYFSVAHDHADSEKHYLLAHTPLCPVGVACVYHQKEEHAVVLSYLSVGSGFRKQGISSTLFKESLAFAQKQNCLFKRTSPGRFASENPGITSGYDKICNHSVWPIINSQDYTRENLAFQISEKIPNIALWKGEFLAQFPNGQESLSYLSHEEQKEIVSNFTKQLSSSFKPNRLNTPQIKSAPY